MGTKEIQPPCVHDFEPSAWEPGVDVCAWPGCEAKRESPVVVEAPSAVVIEALRRAAA